jgi:hypothetical protein
MKKTKKTDQCDQYMDMMGGSYTQITPTTKTKPMTPVVDLGQMLVAYAKESGHPAAVMGARMAGELLFRISERACELKDEVLLDALQKLCLVGENK